MKIKYHTAFKKDLKRILKRGLNLTELETVLIMLQKGISLSYHYRDHAMIGNYQDFRECHIQPVWLLIYQIDKNQEVITLVRTGSHNDLF